MLSESAQPTLEALFADAAQGMACLDETGRITRSNAALREMLGWSEDELRAMTFTQVTHHDDLGQDLRVRQEFLTGASHGATVEKRLLRRNGGILWVRATTSVVRDSEGRPRHYWVIVDDITRRKETDDALRRSDERLRWILEQGRLGMVMVRLDGRLLESNVAFRRLLGYDAAELERLRVLDLIHPEDLEPARRMWSEIISGRRETHYEETRYVRKDGSVLWVSLSTTLLRDAFGTPQYVVGILEDVSDRQNTRRALEEQVAFLQKLMDTIPNPVFYKNTLGVFLGCNAAYEEFLGLRRSEIIGRRYQDLWVGDDAEAHIAQDNDLYARGGVVCYEGRMTQRDGALREVLVNKAVFHHADGSVAGIVGVMQDITQQKAAERTLRENEEKFSNLFQRSSDGIVLHDLDGRILDANRRAVQMFGCRLEDLRDTNWDSLRPPEENTLAEYARGQVLQEGMCRCEMHLRRRSGAVFSAEVSGSLVEVAGRKIIQEVVRDITESQLARDAIRRLRRENEMILNSAGEGIFGLDLQGCVTFINPAAARMIGYEPEDMIGARHHDLAHARRPDGSPQPLEECNIHRVLATGRECQCSNDVFCRRDGSLFPVEYVCTPLFERNELIGVVVVYRDITAQKKADAEAQARAAEMAELNAELARSNRDLEEFTYVVSHDLQEPLRKMHTFACFLQEDAGETLPEVCKDHIQRIQEGTLRMRTLIQHLLQLSRVGRGSEFKVVSSLAIARQALDTLSQRIAETGARIVLDEGLPDILADDVQVEQVFQNLIGNALKFMPKDRAIAPEIAISAERGDGMVEFSVRDNGIGIKPEYHEKIFGVFQRLHTRREYEGSGVGLSLCAKIVRRHGGRIWVESQEGQGSVFRFTLPAPAAKGDA